MASVLWFRKGLRLHDNTALHKCLKRMGQAGGGGQLLPIFVLDPWFISSGSVGFHRMQFLLESLRDLDTQLRALNSRLLVFRGDPLEVIPSLVEKYDVTTVAFEKDTEPYAKKRDGMISNLCTKMSVDVINETGHTLFDMDELRAAFPGGNPPVSYGSFVSKVSTLKIAPPIAAPSAVPTMPAELLADPKLGVPSSVQSLGGPYDPPEGPHPADTVHGPFYGGETVALRTMSAFVAQKQRVATFEKPMTCPAKFGPVELRDTTVLSPHLKFGTLSCRTFAAALSNIGVPQKSQPPVSLLGQLYWREFFYLNGHCTGESFGRIAGNPLCKPIPWDADQELLSAWKEGRTGYPWIDAIMNQLRSEGWIHHLARHCVACFLTRGDLWQSWEKGAAHFDKYLLDADWSINNANWMWLSCSGFFHQFFRVYSPVAFGKKYKDDAIPYIRHYLPVLKDMPDRYLFEPWTAPKDVQVRANCVIGRDYPHPVVDHATKSKANIQRFSAFLKEHKAAGAGAADSEAGAPAPASSKASIKAKKRKSPWEAHE